MNTFDHLCLMVINLFGKVLTSSVKMVRKQTLSKDTKMKTTPKSESAMGLRDSSVVRTAQWLGARATPEDPGWAPSTHTQPLASTCDSDPVQVWPTQALAHTHPETTHTIKKQKINLCQNATISRKNYQIF